MPRPILGALQLEGEVFSLDIPSYRTSGVLFKIPLGTQRILPTGFLTAFVGGLRPRCARVSRSRAKYFCLPRLSHANTKKVVTIEALGGMLSPQESFTRRLMARWSCSTTLFK